MNHAQKIEMLDETQLEEVSGGIAPALVAAGVWAARKYGPTLAVAAAGAVVGWMSE